MLLTFGRSAFALPAISGVSLAAGSASCSATVSGSATAAKKGSGGAVATVARSGTALRTVKPSAACTTRAVVAGSSKKLAAAFGGAVGRGIGGATPTCALKAGSSLAAAAAPVATATKTAKFVYAGGAFARALADGAGEIRAFAVAIAAEARAWVWGTTFEVGRGVPVTGSATCTAAATRTMQAGGTISNTTVLGAVSRKNAAAFGAAGNNVVPIAAARVKRDGVGYQDAFGEAVGRAVAAAGPVSIAPTMLIVARALPQAAAEVAFCAYAAVECVAAVVSGEANLIPTIGVSGATISSAAVGSAMVMATVNSAVGQCEVRALPAAASARIAGAGGIAVSIAAEAADAEVTRFGDGDASTNVVVSADALRRARAAGAVALAAALTDGGVLINPLSASTYVIEVDAPDNLVEAAVPENLVTVDAFDNLVEAA